MVISIIADAVVTRRSVKAARRAQVRRLLREAINTVRAGGAPAGVSPSYYDLNFALQVLPRDADWRQILAPAISPEKILQTV